MRAALELMEHHVKTLFRHDRAERLAAINEPGDLPAPRLFLGRTSEGHLWRFRHDLPAGLVRELEAILITEPVNAALPPFAVTLEPLCAVLAAQAPVERIWNGPAWSFPDVPPSLDDIPAIAGVTFPRVVTRLVEGQPWAAVLHDGRAVSICRSARTSSCAAEAGVETVEPFRRRGFAAAAVATWARAVQDRGQIPLYSTAWENTASQAVARRLNLALYGVDLHIT